MVHEPPQQHMKILIASEIYLRSLSGNKEVGSCSEAFHERNSPRGVQPIRRIEHRHILLTIHRSLNAEAWRSSLLSIFLVILASVLP